MVFLAYIILSEHMERFQRWTSLKAYMILSIIECLFWFVAMGIMATALRSCNGTTCALGGVIVAICVILA